MKGLITRTDFIEKYDRAEETLERLFTASYNLGLAVAVWKEPGREDISIIVDFSDTLNKVEVNETVESGFLISPFINPDLKETILIRPDIYFNSFSDDLQIKPIPDTPLADKFEYHYNASTPVNGTPLQSKESPANHSREFIQLVEKAVEEIRNEKFKKIVLSRTKVKELPEGFNPFRFFLLLCRKHPHAFTSLVSHPTLGTWIGATPELLAGLSKENIFKTIALAATKPVTTAQQLNEVVWTQKEIEEQAIVSRYIINCFKSIRLREYEDEGPRTVQAGNLFHLRTDFTVNINEVPFPDLLFRMLKLLHPTSAVCGTPKEQAMNFITAMEKYDRELFTGFLGPVKINNETSIYVNIRCCKIQSGKVSFFAGAGITKDSVATNELEETSHKMKTLESLFDHLQE
jgi:isochorismate synthase